MRLTLIALAICAVVLSSCGKEEDGMELEQRAEARAAELRTHVDDLAGRIGTDPEVKQDEKADCVPGQEDSGLNPTYTVHVSTDDTSVARLTGDVADHFAAEGWTVKRDPVNADNGQVNVRFAKGEFSMGARISEKSGRASVGGSGGCVR